MDEQSKKVLVACDTLLIGGAETFTMRMARYYRDRGHQVSLVALRGDQINYELVRENAGDIPVISFNLPPVPNWLLYKFDGLLARLRIYKGLRRALHIRKFRKVLLATGAQVVHTNMFGCLDVFCYAAADIPAVNIIHSVHGDIIDMAYHEMIRDTGSISAYDRHCLNHRVPQIAARVDHVIYTAEMQLNIFSAWNRIDIRKMTKIYNPVDIRPQTDHSFTRADLNIPADAFVFGSMLRCVREKGWEELIRAFIMADLPGSWLMLIGGGPFLDYLKATYGSHPGILFLGNQPAPVKYLKLMDAGVSPSWFWESLPTAVIDYLGLSKPVITTDNAECRYMITSESGPAGIVVPLRKDEWDVIRKPDPLKVEEMAAALTEMYTRQDLRDTFIRNTASCFAQFSREKIVRQYEALFPKPTSVS